MLAFSEPVVTGLFAVLAAVIVAIGAASGAVIARTSKVAGSANDGVALLFQRLDVVEGREAECLDALEWSYERIGALEHASGVAPTAPPIALRKKWLREGKE